METIVRLHTGFFHPSCLQLYAGVSKNSKKYSGQNEFGEQNNMRKLFIILLVMVCFFGLDVIAAHYIVPDAKTPREAVQKASVDLLAQVLARMMTWRMKLPQKVDDTTTLDAIRAERSMMIYSMSTTADGEEFDRMMSEIHDHMNETSCAREDYRKMLAYGLSIAISFLSPSGKQAVPVVITPQMCGAQR